MKGSLAVLKALKRNKVEVMFGIPGGVVIPFYDEIYKDDEFRHILVRHEQAGAHMAEGFAKASGRTGTCLGTSGPGATNLVTGIADAFMDSVPIVAFGGQVITPLIGKDAFQEADLMGITTPITKHNFQITDPNDIDTIIDNAYYIANTNRPGPVYVELPKDVQVENVTKKNELKLKGYKILKGFDSEAVKKAAKMLLEAERPVMLIGGGALSGNCSKEIKEIAETCMIPVASTSQGKGVFDERHPLSLGMTGMHGQPPAVYAIQKCDVLFNIGTRFDDRVTGNLSGFAPEAKVINIEIDASEFNKNRKSDIGILGNAKEVLQEMVGIVRQMQWKNEVWKDKLKQLQKEYGEEINIDSTPIDPRKLMYEIQQVLTPDTIVTTGVGEHQMDVAHFIKFSKPRKFLTSGGLGTMGFGFPSAIGAKVSSPENEVINVDGDGSFAMTLQELATAKVNNIKVVNVIMNNGYLGMVRSWNDMFYGGRRSQVYLGKIPDFTKVAEAYSLKGIRVDKPGEIGPALKEALKNDETTVVEVHTKSDAIVLPIVPAGAANHEMIGDSIPKEFFDK
ncbi:MAG: biosynthetic-type acetolactate synthase large subunit [Candidatus Diapherotrites archaeon]